MNRTIVACSFNRSMQEGTRRCIQELVSRGAQFVQQTGSADVALARNMALSMSVRAIATENACRIRNPVGAQDPLFDTVLMVDDDMVFTVEQAQELIDHARKTGVAASAMYATLNGTLAATRLFTPPPERQRWVVGLGLLAIPYELLSALAKKSPRFDIHGVAQAEFTWSATMRGHWYSEDYTLSRRLGGVHLLPIPVGHLKTIPLYPDEQTVACIREGRRLPGDLDSKILDHITDPDMLQLMREKTGADQHPEAGCQLCGLQWKSHVQANHVFESSLPASDP